MRFGNKREAAFWLAAFFDGEGSVSYHVRKGQSPSRQIKVTNTELALINAAADALRMLEITFHIYKKKRGKRGTKDPVEIHLAGREAFTKFAKLVPLQSIEKQKKLKLMLSTFVDSPILPKKILEEMYIDREMSAREITKALNRKNVSTVGIWLRQVGIPVRTKHEAALLRERRRREHSA